MYLARIEMTGFKSFADKTVIEFDQGMTAVVGPNGSGKSNLSEAIRWVLGEQSVKSLRGAKMEDVIFNGTQDRKAVNLAKVTLVLNNEDRYLDYDFSEISITRSYNRNGESNYYINNEAVRLKDIVDLLLDSGLGKNSFAMISQGKVESIFLNKPEERRAIFEEAAGVQKYQFRKIEAERKLNKSSDHLSRVKDIIHELESQLKPLKNQKERALKYQEYQTILSSLEISMYTYQIEQNQSKWDKAKLDLNTVENSIDHQLTESEVVTQKIEQSQLALEQLIEAIDCETVSYQELVRKLEQSKAKLQMSQQERQFNQSNADEKAIQFEQHLIKRDNLQVEQQQLTEEIERIGTEISYLSKHYVQLEKEHKMVEGFSSQEVESLRHQMIEYYRKEVSANNQIQQRMQQIDLSKKRLDRLMQKSEQIESEIERISKEIQEQQLQFESLQQQQKIQNQQHQHLAQKWQLSQKEKEKIQHQLLENERQLSSATYRLQSLKQMQEQYDGYYSGVRAVMKNASMIKGINGTVGELMRVRERYQIAIDTALAGALQHIVVEDDAAARRAIQFLKQQKAGRATFLPKTNIKERYLSTQYLEKAQQQLGFVGIASDLVEYEQNNQNIIRNLLGMTIVMDKVEHAQQLAKTLNHQIRIVTLEGDLLMPGGAISGGRQKQQSSSMLSRQTEIDTLTKSVVTLKDFQQQLEQSIQQLMQEESRLRLEGENSRETVNEIEQKIQQFHQLLKQLENQFKQLLSEQKIVTIEREEQITELEEATKQLSTAEQLALEMNELITQGNITLEQMNSSQTDRQVKMNELMQQMNTISTEKALKQQVFSQKQQQLTMIEEQIQHVVLLIEHYEANQQIEVTSFEQLEVLIDDLVKTIDRLEATQINQQQSIEQQRQERTQLNHALRELEERQRQVQITLQTLYQSQAKLQAQIEKYEELIDNHLNYLNENYQLSYEAAIQQANAVESINEVTKQVKDLRKQIEALGPINLAAIEDYDALNERYRYLVEQQKDLLTAMSQLQETMDEMDDEVTKRFGEAFNQINHQFKRTFKRLFGGGEASLALTNPDDLLTTGVDIIAQPPGKRKQNLALLSGGERAFTAIALLFAILETKPVPFCVLDEVEAALDDANVWRYGEYLQHFTNNTQFIVITHRKGTMEHADVLYGVTMERSGVSKLASVRLSEAKG